MSRPTVRAQKFGWPCALIPAVALSFACGSGPGAAANLDTEANGGVDAAWSPDLSLFRAPRCVDDSYSVPGVDGTHPLVPVDYVELREGFLHPESFAIPYRVWDSAGSKCATASDPVACEAALSAANSASGFFSFAAPPSPHAFHWYLAATRGDRILTVDSSAALADYFGAAKTEQEAVLLAWGAHYIVACNNKNLGGVRATTSGYEVLASRGDGCGAGNDVVRYLLQVSGTSVRVLRSAVYIPGDPGCAH